MRTRRLFLMMAMLTAAPAEVLGQGLEISGFVDASWVYETGDRSAGTFGVDKVELSLRHHVSNRSFVRTDLEWLKDGEGYLAQVEQAYMTYSMRGDWMFTFGKFNAPFGFEGYDAPDLYQFSTSLVGEYGLPGNLTGFSVGKGLIQGLNLLAMGTNGWDRDIETGGTLTWAGRLEYERGGFLGGLSFISGKEDALLAEAGPEETREPSGTAGAGDTRSFHRTVFDVDVGYETGPWVMGAEYNLGKVALSGGGDLAWSGFLVMARREFTHWFGLTVRYDSIEDKSGGLFHPFEDLWDHPRRYGPSTRQSATLAPTFALDEGLDLILELRMMKGHALDCKIIALELLYRF